MKNAKNVNIAKKCPFNRPNCMYSGLFQNLRVQITKKTKELLKKY